MLKNYESTLYTLRDKLKEEETKTLIIDECLEEMDNIIENISICREFASTLQSDIARYNEHRKELLKIGKKFEFLTLNSEQKKNKIGTNSICSYKYHKKGKNNKNIRCIYITDEDERMEYIFKMLCRKG